MSQTNVDEERFQSGYIAILGEPNAGKSTLLNGILGAKLAIVTSKPQTTRDAILGVLHLEGAQLIFLDTPGYHAGHKALNERMVKEAVRTLEDADVVLWMIDSPHEQRKPDPVGLSKVMERLKQPVVVALNKIDLIDKPSLLPLMARYGELEYVREIVPLSARTGDGVDELIEVLLGHLPEGPAYFPEDMITDRPLRFMAAEIVREKVFELTQKELPYSTAVTIELWEDKPEKNVSVIHAKIHVERESQKRIVVGAKGAMIKEIGQRARHDIEQLFGIKVFLELHVSVERDWSLDARGLRRVGYE